VLSLSFLRPLPPLQIDKGHYTTYVKQAGSWMRCDDSWITKATQEEVLRSSAYMLFYVRTTLCYDDDT
jgi:ubiquitin carboxyl-terminal hydrolase 22/27/51